jgi:hypothetical protein
MPYREITDDGGVWVVFSTHPRSGANVRARYADGWLSFHRGQERRRLAPVPHAWEDAPDDQLRQWLRSAELVAKSAEDVDAIDRRDTDESGVKLEMPGGAGLADGADAGRATQAPAAPSRVQKSLDRIRAMLNDIRGDGD